MNAKSALHQHLHELSHEIRALRNQATRAEVTDAAMSGRAECVMLNKGVFMPQAVRFLDNVLRRMKLHQHKKTAMLRQLKVMTAKVQKT
jgi:pyruvate kinase